MIRSQRNFQSSEVYALLVLIGLFGFVVNDLFAWSEARWRRGPIHAASFRPPRVQSNDSVRIRKYHQ